MIALCLHDRAHALRPVLYLHFEAVAARSRASTAKIVANLRVGEQPCDAGGQQRGVIYASAMASVFKYLTAEGGLRLLSTWHLRITPPADFNDPFELAPPIGEIFTEEQLLTDFDQQVSAGIVDNVASKLKPMFSSFLNDSEIQQLTRALIFPPSGKERQRLFKVLKRKIPQFDASAFVKWQARLQAAFPNLLEQARARAAQYLPAANAALREGFTKTLPGMLGVLCLSRNGNQPLMWAHYADGHRGVMIEFDDEHSSFNRRRSSEGEIGYLRSVAYSNVRPELNGQAIDSDAAWQVFALTKADAWTYEEEVRLVWPLSQADKTISAPAGEISLISCPPEAMRSVTLGSKASDLLLQKAQQSLNATPKADHIRIRRARLDDLAFGLVYDTVPRSVV